MGLPKRKLSKARRDKRRTHWKISVPSLSECPRCHRLKLPHYACPFCGFYKGEKVLVLKSEKEKKKRKKQEE
jgi:large subunit ribosomal protein L32